MSAPPEMVEYDGRLVRRFVSYPEPVTDNTIRCGVCGQLDDEAHHDDTMCKAIYDADRVLLTDRGHEV